MKFAELEDYVEEHDTGFTLRTPVTWHRKRGLVLMLAIPFLAVLCGGLCGGGMLDGSTASSDAMFVGVFVGVPVLLLAAAGFFGGLLKAARAQTLSDDSEVRIDLSQGVLRSRAEGTVPLSAITSLELVQPSKMLQWRSIRAKISAAPAGDGSNPYQASAGKTITLLKDLEPIHGPKALALMERIGARINKPVSAAVEMTQTPQTNDRLAVSCHVPVQMVWLIISLMQLKSTNPLVAYHARLSLLLGGLHLATVFGFGALAGAAGAAGVDALAVVFVLLLMGSAFGMLLLRGFAMYKAWKKAFWQPPVFKGLTSGWLPDDQGA